MNKVIEILSNYVGYLEKASNKDLDSMTGNAGRNNYTLFAREYKKYTGANYQGQAWCAMFISVCFAIAYGIDKAKALLCGGLYASCATGMKRFKAKGQLFTAPVVGDIVFYLRNGVAYHTGFVYKVSGGYIYTIEGNTSGASGVIANGGGVCRKSYKINSNMRFGRPDYNIVGETPKTPAKKAETVNTGTNKLDLIKQLQKAVNVDADGIVGAKTRAALPLLKKGSKGNAVKVMQQLIGEVFKIPVTGGYDGDFGSGTKAAVITYQAKNGLVEDGIVGAKTWAKLLA